jgi:transposase-like protein
MKEKRLRRNHTREFKLQCCRQAAIGEKRPAQRICREHNLSESVLLRWRKGYEARGEAAFTPKAAFCQRSPRGEDRRAGAFLRTALPGEPDPKIVAKENAVLKRHAVIEQVCEEHPEMSIERLWAAFPHPSTVRADNVSKVRFSATLGEEPEVKLALV